VTAPARSGSWRRRLRAGALLGALLSAPWVVASLGRSAAAADDPMTWAAKVEKNLDLCEPRAVAEALTDATVRWIAETPDAALQVLRAAFRNARCYAGESAADARTIAAQGLALAKAVRARDPAAPIPDLAQGYALACYARTTHSVGGQTTRADWAEAADLFRSASASDPGKGEALAVAVDLLTEWSAAAGDEGPAALAEAQALAAAATKEQPASVPVRLAAARTDVQAGLMGLAAKKDAARALLARGLDALGAQLPAFENDQGAVRTYHTGLRAARLADVSTKASFVMEKLDGRGRMEIGRPRGQGWTLVPAATDIEKERMFARLRKQTGETSWVTVELWYFQWSLVYKWDKVSISGDNVSSIVEASRKGTVTWLGDGHAGDKPLKGKVSRALPDTVGYDASGKQSDGRAYRSRWWFFKSQERKLTWQLTVIADGDDASAVDPEVEAIVASLKEIKEKEKSK
jgi:hypothetical protein